MNQPPKQKKGTLVIVTGNADPVACCVQGFENEGFEVVLVTQVNKALNIADLKPSNWKPSLFIVDTIIPQASGFEVARRLNEKWGVHKIPVVMMANHPAQEDYLECSQCGAIDLIKKPLSWSALADVIEKERMKRLKAEIGDLVFKIESSDA